LLATVRAVSFARCRQPDWAPAFEALGGWLGLAAVADAVAVAVAGNGDAVGCAPPDDDAVAVPQPAVTATTRHAASPLDRKFI
jgi:hypothetical protein